MSRCIQFQVLEGSSSCTGSPRRLTWEFTCMATSRNLKFNFKKLTVIKKKKKIK
ncbi:hypothetical protein HanIR_Chr13g0648771 [Helianthus annuus]|nr:hypothetical protein HanIR_Chr13g0648771 [Helianthus annuus]